MNSFFNTILDRFDLPGSDGRPLWKYNLTEDDYQKLKKHIAEVDRTTIDPRDLALFYAEWWRNDYEGSVPSNQKVYEAVNDCNIDAESFYDLAKKGSVMLGVRWIERARREFFRTLLLQGGLPVNHMIKNSGSYTNFLKKVMELNPDSIEEFAYDTDLTKLLPISSRNDDVYESCLQIVKAIWNGNEEYIAILEKRQGNENNSITKQLKEHKKNIEKTLKRRTSIKAYWILVLTKNKNACIQLKFHLPQVIDKEVLAQILELNDLSNMQSEYQLLVDDKLLAKLKINIAGNYKVFLFNNATFDWNGEQLNPDIKIRNSYGKVYALPVLSANVPDLNEPTLWVEKSDYEWILVKGQACKQEEAFVLYGNDWTTDKLIEYQELKLYERDLRISGFSNVIKLSTFNNDSVIFRTKAEAFQWIVNEQKPNWLNKSNMPVIKNQAQIFVYNEDGSKINNAQLNWRLTGSERWSSWVISMPAGCIEYSVTVDGLEEKGYLYNIDTFDLEAGELSPTRAQIQIINSDLFNFHIKEEDNLVLDGNGNIYEVSLNKPYNRMPKSIKALLHKKTQVKALHFEIAQPFSGVKIIDPEGNIIENNEMLLLGNFSGYRIFSPTQNNYFVRLYNSKNPDIKLIKKLSGGTSPLREYDDEVRKLIRLSDSMDNNTTVNIEFFESVGNQKNSLGNYEVRTFNVHVGHQFLDNRLIVTLNEGESVIKDLFAIPLECSPYNIVPIPLESKEYGYVFPDIKSPAEKFIITSGMNNSSDVLKPAFVTTNETHQPTNSVDKSVRIDKEAHRLAYSFNHWEKVHKYFEICVQFELPFTTFDIFRAATKTPDGAAKLFCYLCVNAYSDSFLDENVNNLEGDLGFCFHWISGNDWKCAIEWLRYGLANNGLSEATIIETVKLLNEEICKMIKANEPFDAFEEIADFVVNNNTPQFWFAVLNQEIQVLRSSLGPRVLNELPTLTPSIPKDYQNIIPVENDNRIVEVLLKVPVTVALSISGRYNGLWFKHDKSDVIRRNVQFVQWLSPNWYGKAILHCLNRINQH